MAADAEEFAMLLDGGPPAPTLPRRLLELVALAAEVADALSAPVLTRAERDRIQARFTVLMRRRRRLSGELRRHRAVLAGAGGAALGLAMVGVALLRRAHAGGGAAAG